MSLRTSNHFVCGSDEWKPCRFATRLLKETHEVLLEGTRGQEKNPGQTRTSQNWIDPLDAPSGTHLHPSNVEDMEEALSEMEEFVNRGARRDPIVKAALVHYQFETIHPFL